MNTLIIIILTVVSTLIVEKIFNCLNQLFLTKLSKDMESFHQIINAYDKDNNAYEVGIDPWDFEYNGNKLTIFADSSIDHPYFIGDTTPEIFYESLYINSNKVFIILNIRSEKSIHKKIIFGDLYSPMKIFKILRTFKKYQIDINSSSKETLAKTT